MEKENISDGVADPVRQPATAERIISMKKTIRIIGAPMDLGQSRRGVDMGPAAIRYANLSSQLRKLGYQVEDAGNIDISLRDALPEAGISSLLTAVRRACELLYEAGREAVTDGCTPLFLGGDHSISIGTIGGITHYSPAGVIWIDAHGDFNIPEVSPSGNIHGMPVAVLTGSGFPELLNIGRAGPKLKPSEIVLMGIRRLDFRERSMLRESGITVYTMRDIDERGMSTVAYEALEKLQHLPRIHVSLDADSLDPIEAPGVGTPAPGGLTYREAHLLMEILSDSSRIGSMDVVEINPILDQRNQTAKIAVELATSLLGDGIL
ncbi:Arginase (EC [Olavius algarvensis associated proteobacterium Delta 3]|nr:Arginase (EC [Olavius algarvensis associated proteobacterium Delta 3]